MFQNSRRFSADSLVLVASLLPLLAAWIYFVRMAGDDRARFVYLGAKVIQFSLPVVWLWTTRSPVQLPLLSTVRQLGWGVISGLAMGVGILAWCRWLLAGSALEEVSRQRIAATLANFGIDTPLSYLGMAVGLSLVHSLLEELYWRGFVFGRASAWAPRSAAVALSSLAFASHHLLVVQRYLPDGTFFTLALPATLAVAAGGAFWCWLFRKSGSLGPPWISHLLVDAALMLAGYQLTAALLQR